MLIRRYEMPWRTAYEGYAALGWLASLIGLVLFWQGTALPRLPFLWLAAISAVFLLWNAWATWRIWALKLSLSGKGIAFIRHGALARHIAQQPDAIWLGKGFDWTPVHTQRIYEIKRADPHQFYPPKAVMMLREWLTGEPVGANQRNVIGSPWIHGVEPAERDLYVPIQNFIGNTLLLGTTRCGKTRFLELLIHGAIARGNPCIVIDPKGDQDLQRTMQDCARLSGRSRDFVKLHLAFPSESIRLDPLKNYNKPSDLATRIAALIPSETGSDPFTAFAWGVLNAIILGMLEIGEKPTLVKIRSYVENGVADLLTRVVVRYLDATLPPTWEADVIAFARSRGSKGRVGEDGEILVRRSLNLLLAFYIAILAPRGHHNEAIEALATIHNHDAAHYGKMIANLLPVLAMLTTGTLGGLLSPDPRDVSDLRPMTDMQSLIHSRAIVYVGLDALADKTISGAVGAMILADLASVAAAIYNFGGPKSEQEHIYLFVDESAEVVNDPFIQILNKAAGSGFITTAAAQTVPDFAARFGSMDKARMMLGNFNNLFAMRIKDRISQDFVVETFGETYVHLKQVIQATTSNTAQNVAHFSGSIQERLNETLDELVPPELLGQIPNWQYVGSVSGGRIIKGRLPIIQHERG